MQARITALGKALDNREAKRRTAESWTPILSLDEWDTEAAAQQDQLVAASRDSVESPPLVTTGGDSQDVSHKYKPSEGYAMGNTLSRSY